MQINQRIKKALTTAERASIKALAQFLSDESDDFAPTSRKGYLRSQAEIEVVEEGGKINAYLTNKTPYAKYHYTKPKTRPVLRHLFKGNNLPSDLTRLGNKGQVKKGRKKGRGDDYLYGRAYRFAVKNKLLTRFSYGSRPGLRWYHRAAGTPRIARQAIEIYKNKFREIVFS